MRRGGGEEEGDMGNGGRVDRQGRERKGRREGERQREGGGREREREREKLISIPHAYSHK